VSYNYKKVFSTFKPSELALIKSILAGNGIDYFVANEEASGVYPLGISMDIMVPERQAEEAGKLIEDFIDRTK
jgi:hypothetical protein